MTVNDELEKMPTEVFVAYFEVLLKMCVRNICLRAVSNPKPSEYDPIGRENIWRGNQNFFKKSNNNLQPV
jgi:hypothetical protein